MCKYKKFIGSISVFFAGFLYICRKLFHYGIPHTTHRRRRRYSGVREIQPFTRWIRGLHCLKRSRRTGRCATRKATPDPSRYDDACTRRHRDLQSAAPFACAQECDDCIPLGCRQRGYPVAGLQRRRRRLHQQAHKDEYPAQPCAGHTQAYNTRGGERQDRDRPRALHRAQRR